MFNILPLGLIELSAPAVCDKAIFFIGLNDNDGFQMTYAQYYLPSGTAVHKIGITPDIISEMPEDLVNAYFPLGDLTDPQLKDAWEAAKALITE